MNPTETSTQKCRQGKHLLWKYWVFNSHPVSEVSFHEQWGSDRHALVDLCMEQSAKGRRKI